MAEDKQRIIFLDVDGPLINGWLYYTDMQCSFNRSLFSTSAIGMLNYLCKEVNAQIVMNTYHNSIMLSRHNTVIQKLMNDNTHVESFSVKDDLINAGLKKLNFHNEWKTKFPFNEQSYVEDIDGLPMKQQPQASNSRLLAIDQWLKSHPEIGPKDYVCFDDSHFTKADWLIQVDFDNGIVAKNITKAFNYFGIDESKGLIL